MSNKKINQIKVNTVLGIILALLFLGGLVWLASPSQRTNSPASPTLSDQSSLLSASEQAFDFGTISMAEGNVSHMFKVKNMSGEPVSVNKLYTSCMCTSAFLQTKDKRMGPFGMPGHGAMPRINQMINPGEEADVEVVFDPAVHGPAGVGQINRIVYLENDSGPLLELGITANVTP
ncbi:MAG: DUF1573 domain-containing protein [Candidatus Colwellbacteria bacterium]|nr:DUF1573 domain-containing protein [Candidatus Colwellbacteria bacterium]MBI3088713.1 DUF1573 domain-containing protein [Candidatus Colwellbacteria bacterium]